VTIKKGQDWGCLVAKPKDLHLVADDFEASYFLSQHLSVGGAPVEISILKSDLARSLGISGANVNKNEMLQTHFDVIETIFLRSGQTSVDRRLFLGHAFIQNGFATGAKVGVLNSSFVGKRNWAPRAHPNDGKFDVVEIEQSISIRQRLKAYSLMRSGSHLPHPKINYRQVVDYSADCINLPRLYIESKLVGTVVQCSFKIMPDAAVLYW